MSFVDLIQTDKLVELTKTLIAIPSTTGDEKAIGDWLVDWFQSKGITNIQRLPVEDAGDTIIGVIGEEEVGTSIMLNFHLDTFDVFEGWQADPFEPIIEDGKIIGLGAHDMKGGIACTLAAVEAILKSQIKLNGKLIISGTSDEEYWSRGVHQLIDTGKLEEVNYCIVPEPTSKASIIIGQRGRHVI
jgi:acetylornithine deacetylase/succinyl-diaminopimelate desuccinylase-like protein